MAASPSGIARHHHPKKSSSSLQYLLDLHCGDANEYLRPYVYQTITGAPAIDDANARLALPSASTTSCSIAPPHDPAQSLYCSTTAITRGKPAITVESGYLARPIRVAWPPSSPAYTAFCANSKCSTKPASGRKPVYLDPPPSSSAPPRNPLS